MELALKAAVKKFIFVSVFKADCIIRLSLSFFHRNLQFEVRASTDLPVADQAFAYIPKH